MLRGDALRIGRQPVLVPCLAVLLANCLTHLHRDDSGEPTIDDVLQIDMQDVGHGPGIFDDQGAKAEADGLATEPVAHKSLGLVVVVTSLRVIRDVGIRAEDFDETAEEQALVVVFRRRSRARSALG